MMLFANITHCSLTMAKLVYKDNLCIKAIAPTVLKLNDETLCGRHFFETLNFRSIQGGKNMKSKISLLNYFLITLLLVLTSVFWPVKQYAQTPPQFDVKITEPSMDNVKVGGEIDVSGSAIIPSGNHLWVLAHRKKGFEKVWWPQAEGEIDVRTHKWQVHVTIGQERDIGYEFEIAAITVNEQEHLKLKAHWDNAMETGKWRPIPMPPTTSAPVIRSVMKSGD